MTKIFPAALVLAIIGVGSLPSQATAGEVPSHGHEPIKASIVDNNPAQFTIDVMSLANVFADEEAQTFAVYVSTQLPKSCADFSGLDLAFDKPEKYLRRFDLSKHKDVLAAIDQRKCVIVRNVSSN